MLEFIFDYTLNARRLEISRVVSEHEFHVRWTVNVLLISAFRDDLLQDCDASLDEYLFAWYKKLG
jgi:hypothetical protein